MSKGRDLGHPVGKKDPDRRQRGESMLTSLGIFVNETSSRHLFHRHLAHTDSDVLCLAQNGATGSGISDQCRAHGPQRCLSRAFYQSRGLCMAREWQNNMARLSQSIHLLPPLLGLFFTHTRASAQFLLHNTHHFHAASNPKTCPGSDAFPWSISGLVFGQEFRPGAFSIIFLSGFSTKERASREKQTKCRSVCVLVAQGRSAFCLDE